MSPIIFSKDDYQFWQPTVFRFPLTIYEMACAIFRVIAMTFQYAVVRIIIAVRHLGYFPSALPFKNLIVVSRNISNLNVLQTCLTTAWSPEIKDTYQNIGDTQGLRITHDIILRPASGICLGKSLTFLSEYRLAKNNTVSANLKIAAEKVDGSRNETCVRMQAIYDALIGMEGQVNSLERDLFLQILQGKHIFSETELNQELLASIKAFLDENGQSAMLRHFVICDLESQGIEITPNLYALILELDTFWHLQQYPGVKKNDSVHLAIVQAVAHCLQLEPINATRLQGTISSTCAQLEKLEEGSYLIHFTNHTIACVKEQDCLALFDPNEGLALFNEDDQDEGITQLLEFYGSNQSIALHLVEIY